MRNFYTTKSGANVWVCGSFSPPHRLPPAPSVHSCDAGRPHRRPFRQQLLNHPTPHLLVFLQPRADYPYLRPDGFVSQVSVCLQSPF